MTLTDLGYQVLMGLGQILLFVLIGGVILGFAFMLIANFLAGSWDKKVECSPPCEDPNCICRKPKPTLRIVNKD